MYIKELVSCIIPTYKRSDMLIRAINSILNQTYKNIEVIVVDDNNPDDEYSIEVQKKIKESINDKRFRYVQQDKHINGAAARNVGIRNSKGEYIAFLDDDDEWKTDKIEKQIKALNANPTYDGVSCLIEEYINGDLVKKRPPYSEENLQYKILKGEVAVGTVSLLLRRESLDKTGYFNESLRRNQEVQLISAFLSQNKLFILNEYLVKVHRDDTHNRPSGIEIEKIKMDYLEAVNPYIHNYPLRQRKQIINSNYFEIVYVAIRDKDYKLAFKYIKLIGIDICSYKDVLKRYIKKRKSSIIK